MQQVISELQRVRRRGRAMLIAQRCSIVAGNILVCLMGLILFDFVARFPSAFRMILLAMGLSALTYVIWAYLRQAFAFSPSLTLLALRAERVWPALAGRLASSVEFAAAGVDQANPLAARSVRETQTRLAGQSITHIVSAKRTWRNLGFFAAAAAVAGSLAALDPAAAQTGLRRVLLPYSDAKWPARTGVRSLMDQVVKGAVHPRGTALALRAGVTRGSPTQRVDAHYRLRTAEQWEPWQRIVLTHQGGGVHERLVDTNAREIEVYFSTDDDETSSELIDLVPPPAVQRATLRVRPPAYAAGRVPEQTFELGQGLDDRAVTDTASLAGSLATLRFELNKPLPAPIRSPSDSWFKQTFDWESGPFPSFATDEANPAVWTLQWQVTGTRTLRLQLVDEHGLANVEPIAYRIEAVEDRAPSVTIVAPQADQTVLPSAVVSVLAEARDDVGLAGLALEAHVESRASPSRGNSADLLLQAPAWQKREPADDVNARIAGDLDLGALSVSEGDVVLLSAVATDVYESPQRGGGDGAAAPTDLSAHQAAVGHEARSPVRRLRVISEVDFATQLRRQLAAVRQNAIRIEALQAELQDDVVERGLEPGMSRAQAQIGERIAGQRAAVQDIEQLLKQNRLDDAQLSQTLQQSQDLLDFAGRAANKAVEEIERRSGAQPSRGANAPEGAADSQYSGQQNREPSKSESGAAKQGQGQTAESQKSQANAGQESQSQQSQSKTQSQPQSGQVAKSASQKSAPQASDESPEAAQRHQEVVEAQQQVREELADLIKLLDRDEDTWAVKRQLEDLLKKQSQLEAATSKLGERTMGQRPDEMSEQHRSELDRIAQKQREELGEQARNLIEQLRQRPKALEKVDPQSAEAMRSTADIADQQQIPRKMEEAAKDIEQNRMTSAASKQQDIQRSLQQMLNNLNETKRAQAQQLIRQLASLVESIQRLIAVQETELNNLAIAGERQDYSGLDRSLIRLNQNTQGVAGEARLAGAEARRIARTLDRAADAQGAAIAALRADPIKSDEAQMSEERSLELLKEAKSLAEALQKKTQDEQVQKRREELVEAYRKFAERQVAIREQTLPLTAVQELDRRQLVEARRLGSAQDEIRTGLNQLRDTTSEILDSPIFVYVHRAIDAWSASASDLLAEGTVNRDVTDQQLQIADSLGHLIKALQDLLVPPDEFARDQGNQDGGGEGGQQALIPPVAQLRLLQGIQEQVYHSTKDIDGRSDLEMAQRRAKLRDLGQQQRDLMELGKQMLEALQGGPSSPEDARPQEAPKDAPRDGGPS